MNTFSRIYALLVFSALSINCFGMNILQQKKFSIHDFQQSTFADIFFKVSEQTGQSITIFPFKIPKQYEKIPVKVNIRTQYPCNKNYVADITNAVSLVSIAYTVDKLEKNNQTAELDIDIKPLEKVLLKYDVDNKNNLKQNLENEIEKKNLTLEQIKKECLEEQNKLNETKRILSLKAKQPEELDEKIKYKNFELKNLDTVLEKKTIQNTINTILTNRNKIKEQIKQEIEQATPLYKKEPWLPFILGISVCLFVQQAKTYIGNLKVTAKQPEEEYPVSE